MTNYHSPISKRKSELFIGTIIFLTIINTSSLVGYIVNITILELLLCLTGFILSIKNTAVSFDNSAITKWMIYMLVIVGSINLIIFPKTILDWVRIVALLFSYFHISIFAISKRLNVVKIFYNLFFLMNIVIMCMYILIEIIGINIPYTLFDNGWLPIFKNYEFLYFSRTGEFTNESIAGLYFVRNTGIFSEPGLYAVFIVLSIFICLFIKANRKRYEMPIWIISLISTFSTTGLILLVLLYAYYLSTRSKSPYLIILLLLPIVPYIIHSLLIQKQSDHEFSFLARSFDLVGGFKLFIQSPIWGHGFKNHEAFYSIIGMMFGDDRPCSNGITSTLYQLGIIGSLIFFVPFIQLGNRIRHISHSNKKLYNIFLGTLFILVMGEPIQYACLGVAIIGYVISIMSIKNNNESISF